MSPPQPTLTPYDISRLISDHSAAMQMDVVAKLSAHFNGENEHQFTQEQSALAADIFKLLLNRAEIQVRSMIAFNLKKSANIPTEIALKMASDVVEVALPIIEFSQVLTDADLLEIIKTADDQEKLLAIARRDNVSENVSDALVDTYVEKVISTLVQNGSAKISERTCNKILDAHAQSASVMDAMLERGTLPIAIVEKLVAKVNTTLRQSLETKCANLVEMTELRKMFDNSMEVTSLKLIGLKTTDEELSRMIAHLEKHGKLQPFSALCMANLQLFEVSLARVLRIPFENVHQLLKDPKGFKLLYTKAGLPDNMFDAVEICVQAIMMLENKASLNGKAKAVLTLTDVMAQMRVLAAERAVNLDYIFGMMQELTWENPRL